MSQNTTDQTNNSHNPLAFWHWKLHWQILLGLIIGAAVGLLSGKLAVEAISPDAAEPVKAATSLLKARWDYLAYSLFGDLFLNGLKLIVVPIVMSSLIVAVAGIGQRSGFAKLGGKTSLTSTSSQSA